MKKRLFLLPLIAGFALSGCDFSVDSLMFWKEKKEIPADTTPPVNPDVPSGQKSWSTEVQNLMKQHLDGVVLPFVEGTWEWEWVDEEYEGETYQFMYGTSYDATLAKAKSAFSGWTNLGEDDEGDTWYGKTTTNGEVSAVPYSDKDEDEKSFVAIEASFESEEEQQSDWSAADKQAMIDFMGFALPFLPGSWDEFALEDGVLSNYSFDADVEAAAQALEASNFSVTLLEEDGEVYGLEASRMVGDTKYVVEMSLFYFWYDLTISKQEKLAEWPLDEVAEAAGTYMDYEVEVVPQPEGATSYFLSEGDYGLIVECVGASEEAYLNMLEGLNWSINDSYLEDEGVYYCYSPNETVEVDVYHGTANLKIEVMASYPDLYEFPSNYLDSFVKNVIGSIYKVPVIEGFDIYNYLESEDEDGKYAVLSFANNTEAGVTEAQFKDIYNLLIGAGFEGTYSDETDTAYAAIKVSKGKIYFQGVYYSDYGFARAYVYETLADESPLIVETSSVELLVGGSAQIEASLVEGFEQEISFESKDPSVATVTSEGLVEGVAKGSTSIEVSVTVEEQKFTVSVDVFVLEQATEVSISGALEVNNGKTAKYEAVFPEGTFSPEAPLWSIEDGGDYATIDSETGLLTASEVEENKTVTVKVVVGELSATKEVTIKAVSETKDTLTLEKLGNASVGTTYTAFADKSDASDAKYSGRCAGDYDSIQIRSKNQDSGIYSSTSGGTIVSVTVAFNSADTQSSNIKVVASNEPFASVSALHSATVVGEITKSNTTYTFTESYAYVGIISGGGAHYLDSVEFVWIN